MARFLSPESFSAATEDLSLLPFNFERIGANQYLVANMVGDFVRLSEDELNRLVDLQVRPGDALYEKAYSTHLVTGTNQKAQRHLLAARLRSRMSFLQQTTPLHIFVVTLRCEHSCPYCQVSRQSTDRSRFDMSEQTAMRALDIAFASPAARIKIEFQGGEPLLNFPLIRKIVAAATQRSGKKVDFVIASNLALLDDNVLEFCKANNVLLSTSLDGPADLHDKNRPRPGTNSHELAVAGIRRAREILGPDGVGALMTTTEASLDRVDEIIDEYLQLGLDGIFLRPLSPFGFAIKTKQFAKYDAQKWLAFYERGLRRVLEINRQGIPFREFYAALLLTRMLSDRPIGYVDLRSPAGAGLGALVYNYDGSVFASDEGRMLAETGDDAFRLGHVEHDSYNSLILSDKLVGVISSSLTQCAPECSTCVYESHCGADPAYHHATQGDTLGIKPLSAFCARQKGIIGLLLDILENSPEDAAILRRWAAA
ncbi:His-Xaa-Ser system radical SAM maturase HxsB [Bradyrhizobium sp. 48]|uniref:His-Xaa-Ser system radical SAM maturase HxsB n=1 Tax=Bradyrhizobium sp. 48 TaxID=2782676 RepID=UPI001FFBD049|nr:His-Xaa-Ser system radical SAM maturase HxsB [Bradyrhizobium sp. 48]MCK1441487.1 His-Xaa-Ser system radical SAM maturase HxsB [Bradyrhizobium sp. 48]